MYASDLECRKLFRNLAVLWMLEICIITRHAIIVVYPEDQFSHSIFEILFQLDCLPSRHLMNLPKSYQAAKRYDHVMLQSFWIGLFYQTICIAPPQGNLTATLQVQHQQITSEQDGLATKIPF